MTDALGSVDPVRSAREYFLVAGDPGDDRPVTLQYWSFYSFNYQPLNRFGGIGAGYHEGDFESVGVLLSADTHRPRYVWMARHADEGRMFTWDEAAITRHGTHPTVFVAKGSHASYESCYRQSRPLAPGGLIDDHPACDEDRQLRLAAESTPLTDLSRAPWVCWRGLFGHRPGDKAFERIPFLEADAPRSPLWQQHFGGKRWEPCPGVSAPDRRDKRGEEVLPERVSARLRTRAGRLDRLVDECRDWYTPPTADTYLVACDRTALRRFIRSGLEDAGKPGAHIDTVGARTQQRDL
jgi:hypothetical protein